MSLMLMAYGSQGVREPLPPIREAPSREWQYLLGPQAAPHVFPAEWSSVAYANMLEYFTRRVQFFVDRLTETPGYVATPGTVSVTNGSSTITYTGTFSESGLEASGRCKIHDAAAGIDRYFRVLSVDSGLGTAVLAQYTDVDGNRAAVAWPGTTQSGLTLSRVNPSFNAGGFTNAFDAWGTLNYYDTGQALYQAWAAIDNFAPSSVYRALGQQLADHYADSAQFDGFNVPGTNFGFSATPRTSSLYGMICRAHDGKPEWFDGIDRYMTARIFTWLDRHKTGGALFGTFFTTRDAAYVLEFCALLGVVHPNASKRAEYRDLAIGYALDPCLRTNSNPVVNFFGDSNQYVRWINNLNVDTNDDGVYDRAPGGDTVVGGGGTGVSQPFQDAIMIWALRAVMRMMEYHGIDSGASWDTIRAGYLAGVRGWMLAYQDVNGNDEYTLVRAIAYMSGLDTHFRPTGPIVIGEPVNYGAAFIGLTGRPAGFGVQELNLDVPIANQISRRQGNADGIANLGYAYALTGDEAFRDFAAEIIDSSFATRYVLPPSEGGSNFNTVGGDGRMSLYQADTQKNWNQHYGNGQVMKTAGWILGGREVW